MPDVIQFPTKRHHARTSAGAVAGSLNPNSAGSTVVPIFASASENSKNISDGNLPLAFQLLTADRPTPARPAVAVVPPSAMMTASTELSIPDKYSRSVNKSSRHGMEIVTDCELRPNDAVQDTRKDIVVRLRSLPDALKITDAELCRRIGIGTTAWANYVSLSGKRIITRSVAIRLCDEFNLTLDWIYRGKTALIPQDIVTAAREAA